jgi:hypothetical protein
LEARAAVEGVLPGNQEFRSECKIIANEDATTGTEAQGKGLIDRVPDPYGERNAFGDGRLEIEGSEEAGIALRERELQALDLKCSGFAGAEHRVEHMAVLQGKPGLRVRRSLNQVELLSGHDARTAMETEIGVCHGLLLC